MRYFVSDGYFPDGKNSPKREVLIVSKGETYSLVEFMDDASRLYVANLRIEERK